MDKSSEAFRTITEVAETLDLPQHVLRFWETRFRLIKLIVPRILGRVRDRDERGCRVRAVSPKALCFIERAIGGHDENTGIRLLLTEPGGAYRCNADADRDHLPR